MGNVLVMTGSVRKVRATDNILREILAKLETRDVAVTLGDLRELQLPWVDTPISPASRDFKIEHESVQRWSDLVSASDAVLMLTPEYNRGLTGAQKNALDWLAVEWRGKQVGVIGHGFHGSVHARQDVRDSFIELRARYLEPDGHLGFRDEINIDGSVLSRERFDEAVDPVLDAVVRAAH